MVTPPVTFIEAAADALKDLSESTRTGQQRELTAFGDARAKAVGASKLSKDFRIGYELGLQVARMLLMTSAALAVKGVKPEDVL